MRVLVTGGAGFIGSNLIQYLLREQEGIEVINFDILTYAANLNNLSNVEESTRYKFVKGDIASPDQVSAVLEGHRPDIVMNLAAESHVDRSISDGDIFVHTNIFGTYNLLRCCKQLGIKRFCQVSTDEVYGSLGPGDPPFTEDHPIQPNSPYSASKASADLLVRSWIETYDFNAVITRCSNNYGPYQFTEKFIPLFITNALQGKQLPLYGEGLNVRDWIHVRDHCRGLWDAATKGRPGEIYNFGGNNERTNLEITRCILRLLQKPESLVKRVRDRPGHDFRYAISYKKAADELGWVPLVDFGQGIRETVLWYQNNKEWWQNPPRRTT